MTARWSQAGPGAGVRARESSAWDVIPRACPRHAERSSGTGTRARGGAARGRERVARAGHRPVDLPEVSRDASISAQTALPFSWVCVPQRSETRSTM